MSIAAANDDLEDARKVEGVILIAIRSAVLSNQRAAELVGIIWALTCIAWKSGHSL